MGTSEPTRNLAAEMDALTQKFEANKRAADRLWMPSQKGLLLVDEGAPVWKTARTGPT
ncbi:hypothetical protein [Nocardia farcinica]|uniref:hypothetical protein n=1 Tax=Nocardia farcinica TaxID=37329 RepID=UPI00245533E9|nr:hypothetical protein [Nocardia farcinica]